MMCRTNHAVMNWQGRDVLARHSAENVRHDGAVQVLEFEAFAGKEELSDRLVMLLKPIHQGAISAELTGRVMDTLLAALIMNRPNGCVPVVRIDDDQRRQLYPLSIRLILLVGLLVHVALVPVVDADAVIEHSDMKPGIVQFDCWLAIDEHRFAASRWDCDVRCVVESAAVLPVHVENPAHEVDVRIYRTSELQLSNFTR